MNAVHFLCNKAESHGGRKAVFKEKKKSGLKSSDF